MVLLSAPLQPESFSIPARFSLDWQCFDLYFDALFDLVIHLTGIRL